MGGHDDRAHTFQFTIEGVNLSEDEEARMLQAAQEAALEVLAEIDRGGDRTAQAVGGGGLAGRQLSQSTE